MLLNGVIALINSIIKGVGAVILFIANLLPSSPFSSIDLSSISKYVGYLNYVVPVGKMLEILILWCGCIGVYYVYQVALRWLKVVE